MNGRSVVIVGAGLAGARCAETLRAEGFDGDLVLVGEEPVAPYERPALSKEFLAGAKNADDLLLRPAVVLGASNGSSSCSDSAWTRSIETRRTATTSSGLELGWDALVLATGARPRQLPFASPAGVHVLRTLADARGAPRRASPGSPPRDRRRRLRRRRGRLDRPLARSRRDVARGRVGSVRAGARPGARRPARAQIPRSRRRHPHRDGRGRVPGDVRRDASMRSSSRTGP